MNRGFFFTALFLGMFLALLSFAVFYKSSVEDWSAAVAEKNVAARIADVADDAEWDLRQLLDVRELELARDGPGANATVRLWTKMPSSASDPSGALSAYSDFLSGTYSQKAGANVSLGASALSAPFVYFDHLGFNYTWNNASRSEMLAYGASLRMVDSQGNLSGDCNSTGIPRCAFSSASWAWIGCGEGTMNVSLNISDAGGEPVSVNGASEGCVNASEANEFTIVGVPGNLSVGAGSVGGKSPAFGLALNGSMGYDSNFTAAFSYNGPVRATLPVSLAINGRQVSSVVLAED